MILKYKWINAVRLAFLFVPMQEMSAVTHVPMFCPITIGTALAKGTVPVSDSACKSPTEAEELCKTAVTAVPASSP